MHTMDQQRLRRLTRDKKYYFGEGSKLTFIVNCKFRVLQKIYIIALYIVYSIWLMLVGGCGIVKSILEHVYDIHIQYRDITAVLANWDSIAAYEKEQE